MEGAMNPFDELPNYGHNLTVEEMAESAFRARLVESGVFVLQSVDRKDFGADCQIEVVADGVATNARVQVQLKGTERDLNADGSVSIEVSRTNFNYLMMQKHGFYVCYHVPTRSLRACSVETVLRRYHHDEKDWTAQKTLTVTFQDELTVDSLRALAALVQFGTRSTRDRRVDQLTAEPSVVAGMLRTAVPAVHVPSDRTAAGELLGNLYEHGADDVISSAFDAFAAVLGADDDAMGPCYMAEINRGMDGRDPKRHRIEAAVSYFQFKMSKGRYQPGSLHYTLGNAFVALGDELAAKKSYVAAAADDSFMAEPKQAAQVLKNLGSSIERLGDASGAVIHYREALGLDPDLPEAHNALGCYYVRVGRYEDALTHFDRAIFAEAQMGRVSAVTGWKINVLFNLGEGRAAFREINSLLTRADREPWVWRWCAQQVGSYGRTTPENARQALLFWRRFVSAHPADVPARRELFQVAFYARREGVDIEQSYVEFRADFDQHIDRFDREDAAFLWDRLGHWAQDDGDWVEAEHCFRKAYDLEGGHYGYCLGTALNFLDRYEESLPIVREQAETLQPDAMSWFQVAVASAGLGKTAEAVDAYQRSIELDPNDGLAMFNLGGVHWNAGEIEKAITVWTAAIDRFPDHELVAKLQEDFPTFFASPD